MPLDPQMQAYLDRIAASGARPAYEMTPEEARRAQLASIPLAGEPEPVAVVEDHQVPGPAGPIPVRLYKPTSDRALPVFLFFHGGGWVTGSIETVDVAVRMLANRSGCAAVSVDYRLAPEHRFPAAAEDAYAATKWVSDQAGALGVDGSRIGVAGDSAGGNLAAVVTLMARDRGGPHIAYQALVYPVLDDEMATPSYREFTSGLPLVARGMAYYWEQYLTTPDEGKSPYAAPMRAESLRDLPPALIVTAEYDPLRDEGELYANRLRADGVPVELTCYEGMAHAFFRLPAVFDRSRVAIEQVGAGLRTALRP
jgi:acetyl esterase